jgi:hypothetical protein
MERGGLPRSRLGQVTATCFWTRDPATLRAEVDLEIAAPDLVSLTTNCKDRDWRREGQDKRPAATSALTEWLSHGRNTLSECPYLLRTDRGGPLRGVQQPLLLRGLFLWGHQHGPRMLVAPGYGGLDKRRDP